MAFLTIEEVLFLRYSVGFSLTLKYFWGLKSHSKGFGAEVLSDSLWFSRGRSFQQGSTKVPATFLDQGYTFVSQMAEVGGFSLFFPNSVSFGVFSHNKGLGANWHICFLGFCGAGCVGGFPQTFVSQSLGTMAKVLLLQKGSFGGFPQLFSTLVSQSPTQLGVAWIVGTPTHLLRKRSILSSLQGYSLGLFSFPSPCKWKGGLNCTMFYAIGSPKCWYLQSFVNGYLQGNWVICSSKLRTMLNSTHVDTTWTKLGVNQKHHLYFSNFSRKVGWSERCVICGCCQH